MCGRLTLTTPLDSLINMFEATPDNDLPQEPSYNVCPTARVAVATSEGGNRRLRAMRWGFVPHWYKKPTGGPLLINARAETIAEKPTFRAACRERRCLIAVDGFYEWERPEGGKPLPWYVARTDHQKMVFAGIWQDWALDTPEHMTTFAIVTCAANADMQPIHHRLPVILEPENWALWVGEEGKGAARLMTPAKDGVINMHRVSQKVNSNRATGAELVKPIT